MKQVSLFLIIPLLIFWLMGCGDDGSSSNQNDTVSKEEEPMHAEHDSLNNNFAHEDIIILESPYMVSDSVNHQFDNVLNAYMELSHALFEEDEAKVDEKITQMKKDIDRISKSEFTQEGMQAWDQHASLYDQKLKEMKHISGVENKRSYFSHLSEIMYCTLKSFQFHEQPIFSIYCEKALNGKGAYWLSFAEKLENPYLGRIGSDCGETTEKL